MNDIRFDAGVFDLASAELDEANGWLDVTGTCAAEGVMRYDDASELLPAETLQQSAEQLAGVPVTIEHPRELLTPETAIEHTRGTVLWSKMDGKKLQSRLRIYDAGAIAAIQAGKRELSPGYRVETIRKSGVFGGKKYDAIQTRRCYNHLAIVDRARGGRQARLDSMDTTTLEIDGQTYEVPTAVATYVQQLINKQPAPPQDNPAESKMDAEEISKIVSQAVSAEMAKSAARFDAEARKRGEIIGRCATILPASYRFDGVTNEQIVADAIVARNPQLKAAVEAVRLDSSRLMGMLDVVSLPTTATETPATGAARNDAADDPVEAAKRKLHALYGGKK